MAPFINDSFAHTDIPVRSTSSTKSILQPHSVPLIYEVDCINADELPLSTISPIIVPIIAYRSPNPGPVVGITCAVHGNEVNGIPVIQNIFHELEENSKALECGTLIGVPVLNVPGFLSSERGQDGQDLNRLMPGKETGAAPQQYAFRIFNRIVNKCDYIFDLHTASLGRRNSLYVRADMTDPSISKLAQAIQPQIIVHNSSPGGSLRGCAQSVGIKALTIEIGDCSTFQDDLIHATTIGIRRALGIIGLLTDQSSAEGISTTTTANTATCERSYWIFTREAGILRVFKNLADKVEHGALLAEVENVFGDVIERVYAPLDVDTVVVGLEANPVAKVGNRVIHLGVIGNQFAGAVDDGHL